MVIDRFWRWLACGLALWLSLASAHAEPRIDWRLENSFRFFNNASHTEMHRATYMALSDAERRTPVLSAERALEQRHNGEGWAANVLDHTCWEPSRNRYTCRSQPDYLNPRSHRVIVSLADVEDLASVDCTWLTAPNKTRNQPRGEAITLPCDTSAAFDIPFPSGAKIAVEIGGRQVAEADVVIKDVLIVGMGDSFGSGEGNPDVAVRFSRERSIDYGLGSKGAELFGYPARVGDWREIGDIAFVDANPRWLDQACHRSLYSHQLRAALQVAVEDPSRAVTFVGYACSGAEIVDGLFLRYKGHEWVPNPPDLSQLSAVAQAQCGSQSAREYDLPEAYHLAGKVPALKGGLVLRKCEPEQSRRIDILMLSIGGNDVGFSRLVANAVLADESALRKIGGWFGQVHGFLAASHQLAELDDRYKSLNRAIHNILHIPWAESDRIVLVSYPALTLLGDNQSSCPDGRAGMTVSADFALSADKSRDAMSASARLDFIMTEAGRQYGWTFVRNHREQFVGRSICSGWTDHALTSADDLRLPRWNGKTWVPINPADWRPYTPRQRWFRTPNDAYMTGNFHVSKSLLQKALPVNTLNWLQVLLASLYSGAFHPTAEGQAAMADAVVPELRRVLDKYDGRQAQR